MGRDRAASRDRRLQRVCVLVSGRPHTPESRAKLAEAGRKRAQTAETRAKLAAARLGKTHTLESRAIMSAARKGKPSPMKGRTVSDETRAKNSTAAKARWADLECRAVMLAAIKPPPRHLSSLTWPPERVARLRELWPRPDMTALQVFARVGLSKSTVNRKVRELGLPPRRAANGTAKAKPSRAVQQVAARVPVAVERIPAPPDGGTTGERGCRFPLWPTGPAPRPALFCGQPRVGARSYCPCHVAVCFTPRRVAEAA